MNDACAPPHTHNLLHSRLPQLPSSSLCTSLHSSRLHWSESNIQLIYTLALEANTQKRGDTNAGWKTSTVGDMQAFSPEKNSLIRFTLRTGQFSPQHLIFHLMENTQIQTRCGGFKRMPLCSGGLICHCIRVCIDFLTKVGAGKRIELITF